LDASSSARPPVQNPNSALWVLWLAFLLAAGIVSLLALPLAFGQFLFDDTGVPLTVLAVGWIAELGTSAAIGACIVTAVFARTKRSRLTSAWTAGTAILSLGYAALVPHAHDAFSFAAVMAVQIAHSAR